MKRAIVSFFSSLFASYDAMNEYRARGDRNVSRKLSTVDGQFSPLTLPLSKLKINFDKSEIHMCKNLTVLQTNK